MLANAKRINLEQVIRFMDDTDLAPEGKPKPVIDLCYLGANSS